MNLIALEIPDDPAALPGWLDRLLVGLDLAALVAELSAVHGPETDHATSVHELLGDQRDAVLAGGLAALPPDRLRRLLCLPRLLLDLQELVLTSGGPYWERLSSPSREHQEHVERGRRHLDLILATEARKETRRPDVIPLSRHVAWYRRPWVVSLATAAAVLAVVLVHERSRPQAPITVAAAASAWGWNRPGALAEDLPSAAYLNRLADGAHEWFDQKPADPVALARRIAEFRQGCSRLILSEHKPLTPDDRTWLIEKCRGWAVRLDAHLAAVESGRDPVAVRAETDQTVSHLIEALRMKAKELS
jgi:hypothetical protein